MNILEGYLPCLIHYTDHNLNYKKCNFYTITHIKSNYFLHFQRTRVSSYKQVFIQFYFPLNIPNILCNRCKLNNLFSILNKKSSFGLHNTHLSICMNYFLQCYLSIQNKYQRSINIQNRLKYILNTIQPYSKKTQAYSHIKERWLYYLSKKYSLMQNLHKRDIMDHILNNFTRFPPIHNTQENSYIQEKSDFYQILKHTLYTRYLDISKSNISDDSFNNFHLFRHHNNVNHKGMSH